MGPEGLSGGQRRRLSLAVALAKTPAVLIADEPTSGLDAAASAAIMALLADLARDDRVAVVCTIHQPSSSVYEGIGTLLLLTKGSTAYYGPASELIGYVASLGKPVPTGVSVSEHALNLVNADFVSDESVDALIAAWAKRSATSPPAPPDPARALPPEPLRATNMTQCGLLFSRHLFKLLPRDPFTMIVISFLTVSEVMATAIYFFNGLRDATQNSILRRVSYIVMTTASPTLMLALTCIATSVERVRVKREIGNGMYNPLMYILVTSAIQIPISHFLSTLSSGAAWLWAHPELEWSAYPFSVLAVGAMTVWFLSLGQLCGWLFGAIVGPAVFCLFWAFGFGAWLHLRAWCLTHEHGLTHEHALTYEHGLTHEHDA